MANASRFLTAFAATRYISSAVTVALLLLYGLLTELHLVPLYTHLATDLRLPALLLLAGLYLLLSAISSLVWYLWILRPPDATARQLAWRPVYRQIDNTGLLGLDLLLLALLLLAIVLAPWVFPLPALSEPAIFLAAVLALPILLDFFPGQRPLRIVVRSGQALAALVDQVAVAQTPPAQVLTALWTYNEFDPADAALSGPELPEGMIVEIPPRF